jgi:hypothetical protein
MEISQGHLWGLKYKGLLVPSTNTSRGSWLVYVKRRMINRVLGSDGHPCSVEWNIMLVDPNIDPLSLRATRTSDKITA